MLEHIGDGAGFHDAVADRTAIRPFHVHAVEGEFAGENAGGPGAFEPPERQKRKLAVSCECGA